MRAGRAAGAPHQRSQQKPRFLLAEKDPVSARPVPARDTCRANKLSECVKDFLDVVVLFEFVNQRQHFRRLLFRQLGWNCTDIFVLG